MRMDARFARSFIAIALRHQLFQSTMAANGGGADSAVAQPSRDVQESVLARPARKQISFAELDAIRSHSERSVPGMTYNIWYNKMSGGDSSDPFMNKEKSKTRCNIAQDSGYTRADLRAAAAGGNRRGHRTDPAFCCLFFARGCWPKGCVAAANPRV